MYTDKTNGNIQETIHTDKTNTMGCPSQQHAFQTGETAGAPSKSLEKMGWDAHFQRHLEKMESKTKTGDPARVIGVGKNSFRVSRGDGEELVTIAGRLRYQNDTLFPVTGDWVLAKESIITQVLPRKNSLTRGAAGRRGKVDTTPEKEQVMAANIDAVFIVCGLDRDFNLRRIERYLTLVYNCGLTPVIVLTKADLHSDPEPFQSDVEAIAFGVPVHLVSSEKKSGLDALCPYLSKGRTITMVGSSGTGKSTLVNALAGERVQSTATVSEKLGKGRHTTTTRDLILLPQGGMVIDNPGIREIAFWDGDDGAGSTFPEIEALARACRFSNCSHMNEPGCAVLEAVKHGEISDERLKSYQKVERELLYLSDRQHKSADRIEKERWKGVSQQIKRINKMNIK